MIETTKLSSKYQITIPKRIRKDLKAEVGDRIIFVKIGEKWTVTKVPRDPAEALMHLGRKTRLTGTAREVHKEMESW